MSDKEMLIPCCCCSHPPGFCASSLEGELRYKIMRHLKEKGKEYSADNVLLAICYLHLIDRQKTYNWQRG